MSKKRFRAPGRRPGHFGGADNWQRHSTTHPAILQREAEAGCPFATAEWAWVLYDRGKTERAVAMFDAVEPALCAPKSWGKVAARLVGHDCRLCPWIVLGWYALEIRRDPLQAYHYADMASHIHAQHRRIEARGLSWCPSQIRLEAAIALRDEMLCRVTVERMDTINTRAEPRMAPWLPHRGDIWRELWNVQPGQVLSRLARHQISGTVALRFLAAAASKHWNNEAYLRGIERLCGRYTDQTVALLPHLILPHRLHVLGPLADSAPDAVCRSVAALSDEWLAVSWVRSGLITGLAGRAGLEPLAELLLGRRRAASRAIGAALLVTPDRLRVVSEQDPSAVVRKAAGSALAAQDR